MYVGANGDRYAYGSFGGYLCVFDAVRKKCHDTALEESKPNVGTLIADDYYYSKDPGTNGDKPFYWVENATSPDAIFHADYNFLVSQTLFEEAVLDVATVDEAFTGFVAVVDGTSDGRYLIGMAEDFKIMVVRCDPSTRAPMDYAVLGADVDWGNGPETNDLQRFGAAYTFFDGDGDVRVLFASNEGTGLFEVHLPVTIPENCWNAGNDTSAHVSCEQAENVEVQWVVGAAEATSNDGLNCPDTIALFAPSPAPSAKPTDVPARAVPPIARLCEFEIRQNVAEMSRSIPGSHAARKRTRSSTFGWYRAGSGRGPDVRAFVRADRVSYARSGGALRLRRSRRSDPSLEI